MISRGVTAMTGNFEQAHDRVARRRKVILGSLFVAGLPCGFAAGYFVSSNDFTLSDPWPPLLALSILAVFVVSITIGTLALHKVMDEHQRAQQYKAAAFAGAVVMVGYPAWFLLWKASLVSEPAHWAIFIIYWLSAMCGALYYRFK